MTQRPSSVHRQDFPLNDFFSRINRPISTKFGRKHAWGWEFRTIRIKGLALFGIQ